MGAGAWQTGSGTPWNPFAGRTGANQCFRICEISVVSQSVNFGSDPSIARSAVFAYVGGMEVHFNPDLKERLTQRATREGRNLEETVQEVVARYFEEEDRFLEAVKRGEAALQRGESLTHEQVGDRLRRFLQP